MANLKFEGRFSSPHQLIDSPQILTADWADLDNELSVGGANTISIWLNLDINDSLNVRVRLLAKHELGGAEEYKLPISNVSPMAVQVNDEKIEIDNDEDQVLILTWPLMGTILFVQFQVQAGEVGLMPAQILTAYATTAL